MKRISARDLHRRRSSKTSKRPVRKLSSKRNSYLKKSRSAWRNCKRESKSLLRSVQIRSHRLLSTRKVRPSRRLARSGSTTCRARLFCRILARRLSAISTTMVMAMTRSEGDARSSSCTRKEGHHLIWHSRQAKSCTIWVWSLIDGSWLRQSQARKVQRRKR